MSSFLINNAPFIYITNFDADEAPDAQLLTVQMMVGEATYTVTVCGRKTGIDPLTHRPILTHIPRALARHAVTTAFDGMYTLALDKEALVFPPCPDFFLFDLTPLRPLFFEGLPNLAVHGTERLHRHSIIVCPQAFLGFARIEARHFYTDHPEVYVLHCAVHRPNGAFVQYIHIRVETRYVDLDITWNSISSLHGPCLLPLLYRAGHNIWWSQIWHDLKHKILCCT
ncbi:hypothetical protein FISHEDRAFT_72230 [Fistulina hepatica ATCC 64428]|uniref:Uncharacterized protein n=1 Tax=Fistulina hepatica ATCC 64428 TaxID=1128425 RepID=A0A0D7AEW2_9AGAR|nr:hypothetical protein FISHEDRAFT_72230 [Fistulina hepatica ATCC 64428]